MNFSIKHKITSFLLVIGLLLPAMLGFIHAVEQHEHVVCISPVDQHIHAENDTCSHLHFILEPLTQINIIDSEIFIPLVKKKTHDQLTTSILPKFTTNFSERAPPADNVF